MSHLNTSYKLGSVQAAQDFETWLKESEDDNPTAAPSKFATVYDSTQAVKTALQKISKKNKSTPPKRNVSRPSTRGPANGGTRFGALKKKLENQRGAAKRR